MFTMPLLPTTNTLPSQVNKTKTPESSEQRPNRSKAKKPNFTQKHAEPLPLEVHPLPAFQVSNPLSLLRLACTWISHIIFPHSSHPDENYIAYFSPETRSVHVTDSKSVQALWQMGFFGKGTLSRSEPSWLAREKARLQAESSASLGRKVFEDVRTARREERKLFKLERAMLEREAVERQRMIEEGKLDPDEAGANDLESKAVTEDGSPDFQDGFSGRSRESTASEDRDQSTIVPNGNVNGYIKETSTLQETKSEITPLLQQHLPEAILEAPTTDDDKVQIPDIVDQEHLQLSFEETFFLSYGLGVLSVYPTASSQPYTTTDLVELFCQFSSFPHSSAPWITPDDHFLLNYVTYHHFRSLGWVIRSGLQFGVDFLLYNRGPVFSHAEFAVVIVPAYTDRYWNTPGGRARRRVYEQKDWWWLHCVNRVQSAVYKTLVLCYVDIPSELDLDFDEGLDVGKLLRSYKVREFVLRRWVPNRTRD